jgi:glycosyltransferase involved in cell wall biosynthesis
MKVAVLIPRLRIGGADAYMRDALMSIRKTADPPNVLLYVIHPGRDESLELEGVEVVPVTRSWPVNQRLFFIADDMVRRNVGVVFSQLVSLAFLSRLWSFGLRTVLVFQNEEPTWSYCPACLTREHVPFLLTSCTALARRLRSLVPSIPVRIVRPMPDRPIGKASRSALRQGWSVPDDAVVIGMMGTFKLHKRYTQAVRVLNCLIAKGVNAYMVIVGGHSELYGGGEQAFRATRRLAEDLGVQAFLRCPGELAQPGDLYQAFDLFLNTSLYEGLSRSTVSAAALGCPIVTTDVGGQAEILSERDCALQVSAPPSVMADAVIACLNYHWRDTSFSRASIDDTSLVTRYQWQFVWQALHFLSSSTVLDGTASETPLEEGVRPERSVPGSRRAPETMGNQSGSMAASDYEQAWRLFAQLLARQRNYAGQSGYIEIHRFDRLAKVLLANWLDGTEVLWSDSSPLTQTEFDHTIPASLSRTLGLSFSSYCDLVANAKESTHCLQQRRALVHS